MNKTGDKVKKAVAPIAKTLDKLLGTDLEHCKDCEEIKNLLNDGKFMDALRLRLGIK